MRIDIIWNAETTTLDLADGVVTVGGGERDGIVIAGLPHALLTFTVDGPNLTVLSQRSVRIGQALFPARIPRLVLESEELKLPNDVIVRRVADQKKRESRKTIGTAFVAQELLSNGEVEMQSTRAATLTCVTGLDQGRTFAVAFDVNIIGRADDAAIRIRDRAVSRQHARLVRKARAYVIEPITDAMNGAYVNGQLVRRAVTLTTGDTIEVGHTVLRFDSSERAPEEATIVGLEAPRMKAEPITAPRAADQLELSQSVSTAPIAIEAPVMKRMISIELVLMSAGAALALLGVGVVVLVLR